MKISKKFAVPALVLGLIVLGGGTALAAGNGFDVSKLSGFTDTQKQAIEKAFQIRQTAETEAKTVLDAAGVDQKALHDQMRAGHETERKAMEAALDANDYEAFKAAVANSPMKDKLTNDTFAKLVQIHTLEKAGDKEGAAKLRKDLGVGFGMGMGGHGGHGPQGIPPSSAQ